jgi:hypothetical protein
MSVLLRTCFGSGGERGPMVCGHAYSGNTRRRPFLANEPCKQTTPDQNLNTTASKK